MAIIGNYVLLCTIFMKPSSHPVYGPRPEKLESKITHLIFVLCNSTFQNIVLKYNSRTLKLSTSKVSNKIYYMLNMWVNKVGSPYKCGALTDVVHFVDECSLQPSILLAVVV